MTAEEKELVFSYLPLVQQIAYRIHRHLPTSVDVRDLIGYGVLALVEALPKLDNTKNPIDKLSMEKGGEVSDEELAEYLGESPERLREDLQAISFSYLMNLDELFQEGRSYEELFESTEEGPEEAVIRKDLREKLLKAIEGLDYREKLVLQLLYYEELPLKEVAGLLGVSMARVSQIKANAIEKLKRFLASVE